MTAIATGGPVPTWKAWWLAVRPATLVASIVPVLVGVACAVRAGAIRPVAAVAALIGAMLIQVGTNLANDVFDHEKGADTAERLGPMRVVQAGLLLPRQVKIAMALCFSVATLAGVALTLFAGPAVVIIGLASIAAGIGYTAGPYPLGYHGLGDLFVFAFFGPVAVCGTAWVSSGSIPALAWWCALPIGALATAVLVVNNIRDRNTDVVANKRTLAVRFGRRVALVEYGLFGAIAYFIPVLLLVLGWGARSVLLPLLTLPLWILAFRRLVRLEGRALNAVLGLTARVLAVYGVLLAVGVALS